MNPFDRFLGLRPHIESDAALMANLRFYANTDDHGMRIERLTFLGCGTSNSHYRIGRINDVWIATRDYYKHAMRGRRQQKVQECYVASAVECFEEGKRTIQLCGGIYIPSQDRYMLLVEDLTRGGGASFKPGAVDRESSMVDGEEVWHDFDIYEKIRDFDGNFRYMREPFMITLRK